MTLAQTLAIIIFLLMFAAIIVDKVHRYIPALVGATFTIVLVFLIAEKNAGMAYNVLNPEHLTQYRFWFPGHEPLESNGINWQHIIFIGGMMAMVEGMAKTGFFRWLCLYVAKLAKYRAI